MKKGYKKGEKIPRCKCGHEFTETNILIRIRDRGRGEETSRICRECHKVQTLDNYYKHKEKNREKTNNRAKEWRENNKDRIKSQKLFRSFGITLEDYNNMIGSQNNKCKICGLEWDIAKGYFPVDHDHATGKVRGILCPPCNRALGWYEKRSKQIKSYLNE
jgi:hypothetical protein